MTYTEATKLNAFYDKVKSIYRLKDLYNYILLYNYNTFLYR